MADNETATVQETAKTRKTRKAQPADDELKYLPQNQVLDALLGPKESKEGRSIGLTGRLTVFAS